MVNSVASTTEHHTKTKRGAQLGSCISLLQMRPIPEACQWRRSLALCCCPLPALSSRFRIVSSRQFGMTQQTTRNLMCPAYFLGLERRSTPVQCPASGRPIISSQDADLQL